MKSGYLLASFGVFALLHSTANALNECMATLKDPHGSIDVSCDGGTKAMLKGGEHFLAAPRPDGWNVYLKSGCHGFIEKNVKLRLLPNEPLMKLNYDREKKLWQKLQSVPDSERYDAISAKEHGVNYFQLLTAASNGDLKAMARFFSLARFMDTSAAEEYYPEQWVLAHVVDDEAFARFLVTQPAKVRAQIGETFTSPGDTEPISKPKPYIKRYFPKSYRILFGG
jgi:hypothetical protein